MPLSLVSDCTRVESHLESKNSMLTTVPQSLWRSSLYLHQRLWVKFFIDTMVPIDIVKFPNSTRSLTSTVVQCRQYLVQLSTLQFTHYAYRNIAVARSWFFEVEKSSWVSKCNVDNCSWKLMEFLLVFTSRYSLTPWFQLTLSSAVEF